MTTITQSPIPEWSAPRRSERGFTLVEVMVSAGLAAFILAAILSAFLFMGRGGANLSNYSEMEVQARTALETFAQDVRQASSISWNSNTNIVLTVNSAAVQYAYESSTNTFWRRTASGTESLITGVVSGSFAFKAFNVAGSELSLSTSDELTAAGSDTKQLQISLEASRTSQTVVTATNLVLSARFILRNKIVTA